jgi:hypothetical protein
MRSSFESKNQKLNNSNIYNKGLQYEQRTIQKFIQISLYSLCNRWILSSK